MPKNNSLPPLIIDEKVLFALPEPPEITSPHEVWEKPSGFRGKSKSRGFKLRTRKSISNAEKRERIGRKVTLSTPKELSKRSLAPTPRPENGKDFDFDTTHTITQGERTGRKITLSTPRELKCRSIVPTSRPENVKETSPETTDATEKKIRNRSKSRNLGRARSSNSKARYEQHVRFSMFEESSSDSLNPESENTTTTVFNLGSIKDQAAKIDCLALRGVYVPRLRSKSRIRSRSISRQSSITRTGRSSELSTPRYLSGRSVAPTPRAMRNLVETPRSIESCDLMSRTMKSHFSYDTTPRSIQNYNETPRSIQNYNETPRSIQNYNETPR